jgi:hypothetical protein
MTVCGREASNVRCKRNNPREASHTASRGPHSRESKEERKLVLFSRLPYEAASTVSSITFLSF